MWLWEVEWRAMGFRKVSRGLWLCERRFGLPEHSHISAFVDAELRSPGGVGAVQLAAFHVTFEVRADNVHFYYHEVGDSEWEAGGYTSAGGLRRLGVERDRLRAPTRSRPDSWRHYAACITAASREPGSRTSA